MASANISTNSGWSKYWRSFTSSGASGPAAARPRAMSSTYCRQLEYPPQADVVNTAARRIPLSRMAATVSSMYGSQFRFPKYTGSCGIAASSSDISARLMALIGDAPPKCM